MASNYNLLVGEALVGERNEIAHIDLLIGTKDGPVGAAFASALATQSHGHSNLLAVLTPNLAVKPSTVMITKVTIKGDNLGTSTICDYVRNTEKGWVSIRVFDWQVYLIMGGDTDVDVPGFPGEAKWDDGADGFPTQLRVQVGKAGLNVYGFEDLEISKKVAQAALPGLQALAGAG